MNTKEQLEEILQRVEEGTTTGSDADALRQAIDWKELQKVTTVEIEQNIDLVSGNLTGVKINCL